MTLAVVVKQWWICVIPVGAMCFGAYLDHLETLRMTKFRGKSKLYGKPLKSDEKPPWP